jgi:hypothetical protein
MSKLLNIKILLSLFFLFILFDLILKNDAKAACVSVDGILQSDSVNSSCETQPEIYQVRIYQVMLCTSQPTAPTTSTSSGLSMCQNLISSDEGSVVRIDEIGGDGQTITGDKNQNISSQSYEWSVVKLDNTFGIQGSFQFEDPYNGEVSGSGNYCATSGNSGTKTSTAEPDNTSICDSSPVTAQTYTITRTSFTGDGGGVFSAVVEVTGINDGTDFNAYLIDSGDRLSENDDDSDKIIAFIKLPSAINVGSGGNFQVKFNMGEGIGVDGIGGEINFDEGPFEMDLTYTPS